MLEITQIIRLVVSKDNPVRVNVNDVTARPVLKTLVDVYLLKVNTHM